MVWAIHPLHTSAVAYISGRADPLAAAFGFARALFWTAKSARDWKAALDLHRSRRWNHAPECAEQRSRAYFSRGVGCSSCSSERIGRPRSAPSISRSVCDHRLLQPAAGGGTHSGALVSIRFQHSLGRILIARAFAEYTSLVVFPIHLHMDRDVETHPFGFGDASMTAAAWRELETLAGLILARRLYLLGDPRTKTRSRPFHMSCSHRSDLCADQRSFSSQRQYRGTLALSSERFLLSCARSRRRLASSLEPAC